MQKAAVKSGLSEQPFSGAALSSGDDALNQITGQRQSDIFDARAVIGPWPRKRRRFSKVIQKVALSAFRMSSGIPGPLDIHRRRQWSCIEN